MRPFLALLGVGALIAPLPARASDPSIDISGPLKTITANEIGGHLRFLASDLMKGRDTATPETRLASEYLASQLFAAGAEPGSVTGHEPPSYFQEFPLEAVTPLEQGTELVLTLEANGSKRVIPCRLGSDFITRPEGLVPGEVEASVVFAGFGRSGSDAKSDDYAGLDVKNRFVLVFEGLPGEGVVGGSPAPLFNPVPKLEAARKHGALGILVVQAPGRKTPAPDVPFSPQNLGFSRPGMTLATASAELPVLRLSDPIRDLLAQGLGLTAEPGQAPDPGRTLRARFQYAARKSSATDRNVIGLFPGSDPKRKHEVILFSAHYDHVGVNGKGEIFNGSDDNASGTSALLEIAEAVGNGPRPARSVAFLWVSGEEKGLLGSRWFADHPSLPADHKVVADINLDMVSRNDPRKIGVTPSPSHLEHNSLVPAAIECSKAEGLELVFDADAYFHRTDSASFARKGIPVIFFFAGVHEDYHRPTDDYQKADTEKAARVARAAYRLGIRFARSDELPKHLTPAKADTASAQATKAE